MMKKNLSIQMPALIMAFSLLLGSCKKDVVDRTTLYPALAPSNIDLEC